MQDFRTKNIIHFHFIVFIFGFSSVLGALCSLEALPLVIYRMALAFLGLGVYFAIFKPSFFKLNRALWPYVLVGGLVIGVHWVTFFHAIKVAGVSLTLSMMATGAFITAMLEPLMNNRKILAYELLFGGLIAFGVGLIFKAEYEYLYGISIALISAFLSSVFTILNARMVQQGRAITLSFYELVVGAVVGILYVLVSGNYTVQDFYLEQWDLLWILLIAWVCTSYAFNISIKVMEHLSPFTVMMIINLEPVYGILLSLIVWGEQELLSVRFYIGFCIILSVIFLNGIYKKQKQIKE
jgi:drug/metabolite transporter (DMT)-like permease